MNHLVQMMRIVELYRISKSEILKKEKIKVGHNHL
jgi:hypothetical protein